MMRLFRLFPRGGTDPGRLAAARARACDIDASGRFMILQYTILIITVPNLT